LSFLLVAIVTVAAAESFFWLPLMGAVHSLQRTARGSIAIIGSKTLSDEEKQKKILHASGAILASTMKISAMLLFVGFVAVLTALALDWVLEPEKPVLELFATWSAVGVSAAMATVYLPIRRSLMRPKSDYSRLSRILHWFALSSPSIMEASFDLEKSLSKTNLSSLNGRHVFISGLARAGTTILMREFYSTNVFRSLTYRDMPFIMMPNTWAKLSSLFRQYKEEEERIHGDRIKVNFDSPEAFEEVFWRCFCERDYIGEKMLTPHSPDAKVIEEFRHYTEAVVASAQEKLQTRYLSKNNNNLLRLPAIQEAFPHAMIIIPFRNPIQHSLSLQYQHAKFLKLHDEDPFSLKYMNWLGHHEFGRNHKPFRFDGARKQGVPGLEQKIEYWLTIWLETYEYLLKNAPEECLFVSYERLCAEPSRVLGVLFEMLQIRPLEQTGATIRAAKAKAAPALNDALQTAVHEVYGALERRSV
jgi:hypothetical protein